MFTSLFRSKTLRGTVAVIDVKNGSVGGALVLFREGDKPLIRYAHRLTFDSGSGGSSAPAETMLRALRELTEKLCTHGLPRVLKEDCGCKGVDQVVAFIGSPWVDARVVDHPVRAEKPIMITERWLQGLMAELLQKDAQPAMHILERTVLRAELNGYPTSEPVGKEAKRVNLSVFEARVQTELAQRIREALQGGFHLRSVVLRSALLATFTVVRDHFESEDNFLLVNVGSHLTEMAVVRNDALVATGGLARGSHTLIEMSAAHLRTMPEEVPSVLRMSAEEMVHDADKTLRSGLAALESDWQREVDRALTSLKSVHGLPRTVFLFAPESTAPWFSKMLSNPASAAHTLTREPFRVVQITGEELLRHYHLHAEVIPDGPLTLETLFLHKVEY